MTLLANSTRRICKCEIADFLGLKPLTLNQFEMLQVDLFAEIEENFVSSRLSKILSILAIYILGPILEQVSSFLPF